MKNIEDILQWADRLIFDRTGENLTSIEEAILTGVWSGKKYPQIATKYNCSESHVKKEAAKLWDKLRDELGEDLKKYNFRSKVEKKHRVSQGSNFGYCVQINEGSIHLWGEGLHSVKELQTRSPSSSNSPATQNRSPIIDLTDAPELTDFYDRTTELSTLKQWILNDQTRLITIYGFSEIGKSALALKLIEQIHNQFDYIIWRSLSNVPRLSVLQIELKEFFAQSQPNPLPTVIDYFRSSRCLVILDDLQTIFQSGQLAGEYLTDYKDYGKFLKQIARTPHQSCVILLIPFLYEDALKLWALNSDEQIMGRKLTVDIVESLDELKRALQHSRTASSKERLQVLYWLKGGQLIPVLYEAAMNNKTTLIHRSG